MRFRLLIAMVTAVGLSGLAGCDAPAPAADPNLAAATQTQVLTASEGVPAAKPQEQLVLATAPPPAKDLKIIAFVQGSDAITDEAISQLGKYARYLAKFRKSVILTGYTRKMGNLSEAKELSTRRAEAIRRFLILHDVSASQIEMSGKGDSAPVDTGTSEVSLAKNDRVELETVDKLASAE